MYIIFRGMDAPTLEFLFCVLQFRKHPLGRFVRWEPTVVRMIIPTALEVDASVGRTSPHRESSAVSHSCSIVSVIVISQMFFNISKEIFKNILMPRITYFINSHKEQS